MASQPPRPPLFLMPGDAPVFPDPRGYDGEGLVAVGGDLATERLLVMSVSSREVYDGSLS